MPITIVDFTLALPSCTSGSSLPEVLEQLHVKMATEENWCWKIVVVNNHTDNSIDVVRRYETNWPQTCPLKSLLDKEEAAALARYRANDLTTAPEIDSSRNHNFLLPQDVGAFYEFNQEMGVWGNLVMRKNLKISPAQDFHNLSCFLGIVEPGATAYHYKHYQKKVFLRNSQESSLMP